MLGRVLAMTLVAGACPLLCQDDFDLFRKANVNIGGGFGFPVHPLSRYATWSGSFVIGAGYDFGKRHSVVGEFMWAGLTPNRSSFLPTVNPSIAGTPSVSASSDLYSVTANYMHRKEWQRFGVYGIGGGGWYHRHAELRQENLQSGAACINLPYWGFSCTSGAVVTDATVASTGSDAFGLNGGFGITVRLANSGEKFYIESRYHYAMHKNVATHILPVTFGFRW